METLHMRKQTSSISSKTILEEQNKGLSPSNMELQRLSPSDMALQRPSYLEVSLNDA